ncbi:MULTISPECIES: helix-turn-helix domain-containing protein [Micromonospora]|uniref:Helix-turn-helix domain-containing protein n=1 Tax=Micromonospora solifontis TaxID=2487138 RepID=A0ABX9WAP7_9ACTN|nr:MULTISPECIES: helix-turn-helix domain-containing protein [Micromonospora]NES15055.1 helix-turn-helix domain-containing protein [Micromonospora sp. PPF5-17B]NES38859.1 helix-turn-helix domain-containing protein [Micromonospora solifontis]NES56270.1 helix-turn-helix domain-containing protein [Micromonospora sp. PPF5-6]RNL92680.1 helix-turn-helix domain-containing protein [Micromonospora solifontis]
MGQRAQERAIAISPEERKILLSLSDGDRRGGEPLRAAIVLTAAAGLSQAETARRLATTPPTVATWLRRYAEEGVPGLRDRVRPGRRPRVRDADVVLRTLTTVPPGGGVWSSRALGVELGVSNGTVARVWRRWGLRPAEPAGFRLPGLPDLPLAGAELVGLHCDPRDCLLALAAPATSGSVGSDDPATDLGRVVAALTSSVPAGPTAASPPSLGDFLAAVAEGRSHGRLHLLAAGDRTARRPAVRAWAARYGHQVRVAPIEPTWTELAAVAAGLTAPVSGRPAADLGGRLVAALQEGWRTAWFSGQPCHWLAAHRPAGGPPRR